jgi:pimeloyl-ACP methyl ester carboxylesterase
MGEAPTPEVSAVELAYSNRGSGPPLVILHGLYGSSTNWRTIANHFETAMRSISRPSKPWSLPLDPINELL